MTDTENQPAEGPLHGVTVCDFTHGVAGPYTAMLLADLGADVWKIEKPGRGDATRYMNVSRRFRGDIPNAGGDYFLAINRNKRSVALDLKSDSGKELALRLAASADIVLSNFRPGVMDSLGLGYDSIRELNPRVIYASLSAYGEKGPLAAHPGMDVAVQARSGVMSITGYGGMDPIKPGVSLADFSGGSHLTTAVLAALYQRERTGVGQRVTLSLLEATMSMLINYSVAVVDGDAVIDPMGSGHPQLVPFQAFPTSDGYVVIATGTNRLFADLCDVLSLTGVKDDPRFVTNVVRVENRAELIPLIEEVTRTRTTAAWLAIFEANGIPCAPVNTMAQALNDPQMVANDGIVEVEHPSVGKVHVLASPYHLSEASTAVRRPPPMLGEHTAEILREVLGVETGAYAELQPQEVV
ncbi:CaiB/BaiF CoA transferase family protein [Georgenia yuyongxinii]|uniref:CoA transferase n=1 Tax=Georgenia yuyongxinii TaxID=2589797 RepID=A0A552WXY2_9MICO|nr:CoA transferase [Georgenia yuyongxinii]TRW47634.1 CoA transferase [Georgenia yuyongxinii]